MKNRNEYDKKLRTKSKPYKDLIKPISGLVQEVKGYNIATTHTPIDALILGGRSPVYKTGYKTKLEIIIKTNSPVKTLLFNGNCPIKAGDEINAYIFAGERKELGPSSYPLFDKEKVFTPRNLSEKETTLYIETIKKGEVIRTDYSVEYTPNHHNL